MVFDRATLSLPAGCYALQGASGCGKSTLLALLAGARRAERGDIWIDGVNLDSAPKPARRRLSYVPDRSPIYPFMTGGELLRFVAMAKRVDADDAIAERAGPLGVAGYLGSRFDAMSFGTQKKLLLCAAWIGAPRVMLLDEPSNGIDDAARALLVVWLRAASADRAVLFATHDAEFVAAVGAAVLTMESVTAMIR